MICNRQLASRLEALSVMESLFDDLEDVAFFIKDEEGRYVIVNRALVTRCGFSRKQEVVGRTTDEVYPAPFGDQYREQDRLVLETDTPIKDKLELQLYVEGAPGWCLTNKVPIHGDDGSVVGMTGLSRDLHIPKKDAARLPGVSRVVDHIWAHYDEQLRVATGRYGRPVGLPARTAYEAHLSPDRRPIHHACTHRCGPRPPQADDGIHF